MIDHRIAAVLAAENRRALLDRADAHRLARQAQAARRGEDSTVRAALAHTVTRIRTAGVVRIRPITAADAPLLSDGFARLSTDSRRLRFFTPKTELTPAELRYFTDVDHHNHEALVAVSRVNGRGLGVARYVRHSDDRETADVAVTVVDAWQGRGLGTELVTRLSGRARMEGIRRFTAMVSTDNRKARRLLGRLGTAVTLLERERDTLAYEIALAPTAGERRALRWYVLAPGSAGCGGTT